MEASVKAPALPKEVADKYDLVGLAVGRYEIPGLGIVDLETISVSMAGKIAKKFPYLVEKPAEEKKAATSVKNS